METVPQPGNDLEKERALIEKVESWDCFDEEKMNLLLVYKDLKRVAALTLDEFSDGEISDERVKKSMDQFISICNDMKILYKQREILTLREDPGRLQFFVSKTQGDLDTISQSEFKSSHHNNALETGILLGYPKTAVEAYVKGSEYTIQAYEKSNYIPAEILEKDFMAFDLFVFSKEHWQDELKTVEATANCIQKTDPALYERWIALQSEQIPTSYTILDS